MNLWRLLLARPWIGRWQVLLAVALSALATGAAIVAVSERLAGASDWVLPGELAGALLAVTGAGYGMIWSSDRIGGWMTGLARQLRRALVAKYLALEPAGLAAIAPGAIRDGAIALPSGLASLGVRAPAAAHSWMAAMACVLIVLAIDPVSGAALLVAMKLGAVVAVARVAGGIRRPGDKPDADTRLVQALDATFRGLRPSLLTVPRPGEVRVTELDAAVAGHGRIGGLRFVWGAMLGGLPGAGRLALAAIVVAVCRLSDAPARESIAMASISFLLPFDWIEAIPLMTGLSAAADRLAQLDTALLDASRRWPPPPRAQVAGFETLELAGAIVRHPAYPGAPGAIVGPVSCRVAPGKVLLVTGGFGAGKRSVLHMLAGIAPPEGGAVLRDGVLSDARDNRGLSMLVTADPVLFSGTQIPNVGREDVRALIDTLELAGTPSIAAGRVVRPDEISVGERARLALLIAVASDAPLLLLDEWDARQTPEMRSRFYRTVLPDLRTRGRAVVVATQDESVIGVANYLVRMENGRTV